MTRQGEHVHGPDKGHRPGPKLRKAAERAQQERADAAAKAQEEAQGRITRQALERVAKSPLASWFPDVVWEYVADIPSGATLVREKGGDLPLVLGVRISNGTDQGPERWKVGVYDAGPGKNAKKPEDWKRVHVVDSAAELGDYIDAEFPQPA